MKKTLLTFSCNAELAAHFLTKTQALAGDKAALLLAKQLPGLSAMLRQAGISELYVLPEPFYGRASESETHEILGRVRQAGFSHAYYPLNDFGGNVAVMLAPLADQVCAINVTTDKTIELPVHAGTIDVTGAPACHDCRDIQTEIVERLKVYQDKINTLWSGERSGEKPTTGLLNNFPYDSEVLSRYAYAATRARGKVGEIGCGLGYGAYLMSRLNPDLHVEAIDQDPQVIALASEMWRDSPRLSFKQADAHTLPWQTASLDSVVSFEVIEHVQEPRAYVEEIARVLRQGGEYIGSTPDSDLFPYRVNLDRRSDYHALRAEGFWPWHIQYFQRADIEQLLDGHGFAMRAVRYPTYQQGVDLYNRVMGLKQMGAPVDFTLLNEMNWSVESFVMSEEYINGFSGYSFIYAAEKGGDT